MADENIQPQQNESSSNVGEGKLEKENEILEDAQNDYHNRYPLKKDKYENLANVTNEKKDEGNTDSSATATPTEGE
jgi:hypothetical protein